jgi:dihydroflavonol-4-reductase
LRAADRGTIGEKYILGYTNLTLAELLARLARLSGLPAPRLKVPYAVAYAFALGAEAIARAITHRAPRASLTEVRMARKRMFFDSTKARSELGYNPGLIDDGLGRAIAFFRCTGMALSLSR